MTFDDQVRKLRDTVRTPKRSPRAKVAASIAAGLAVLAGTLAQDVPPHQDRVSYLSQHLTEQPHWLQSSGYFSRGLMLTAQGQLASAYVRQRLATVQALGTIDADLDGEVDMNIAAVGSPRGGRQCLFEAGDPAFQQNYEVSTDAWYRALTEGNTRVEPVIGESQWERAEELCEGRWQAGGLESVMQIPGHRERIAYLERHLLGQSMEYSPYFEKAIAFTEDPRSQTQHVTLGVMVTKLLGNHPFRFRLLSIRDIPPGNDGTVDTVVLFDINGDDELRCTLWAEDLPEGLQATLNEHYENSTEATYLALTEGKKGYSSVIGEREFLALRDLCR
ncbi:hypothetical protein J4439_02335 [Candidatus Woesearchaeota archaeon]|nr:hypothetical protein [Candidatus Woesearchaeota archaeon]